MTMMSRKPDALREPAEVLKAFKLFEIPALDKEKAGYVRQSSLIHALSNLSGEKLSRSEATELLSQNQHRAASEHQDEPSAAPAAALPAPLGPLAAPGTLGWGGARGRRIGDSFRVSRPQRWLLVCTSPP